MKRLMRAAFSLVLLGAAVVAPAQAQQYSMSTVAGGSPPVTPAIAVEMPMVPKALQPISRATCTSSAMTAFSNSTGGVAA